MSVQKSCFELLEKYKSGNVNTSRGQKLSFKLENPDYDVYNITAPFEVNGVLMLAGRVEPRDSEDSHVIIFRQNGNEWVPLENVPPLHLQDPFITFVNGQLVLGGVEIFHQEYQENLSWRTVFYRGSDCCNLKRFAAGPDGMKDIRLKQLPDGDLLLFTRPQGVKGGRGKIGCTRLKNLEELTPSVIAEAPLIPDHFMADEWGGVNEIHILKNNIVGLLSHIACFDNAGSRHYYSSCFAMNYETRKCSNMKIIACRDQFPSGPAKRPDIEDVLFSGGLIRHQNGTATLYCGVSDAEAHQILMPDPFIEYETGL